MCGKRNIWLFLLLIITTIVLSQSYFTVANKKYTSDSNTKTYRYNFALKADSFQLQLIDSSEVLRNNKQAVSVTKRFTKKDNLKSYQEIFETHFGKDSIRRWYDNNKLIKTEELKYDGSDRLANTSFRDLQNPKNIADCKYLYKDSITENGKITTMMAFKTYAKMFNSLDYKVKTYYNIAGDTIKQVRVDINGEKDMYNKKNPVKRTYNTIIYKQEASITKAELKNQNKLINKYLLPLKQKFKDPKYIFLEYAFVNQDSTIQLLIKKNRRENIQGVEITVK